MKANIKRVVAAVAFSCWVGASFAAASAEKISMSVRSESIPHAALFGLSFDQGKGVAVGAGGLIYESTDAGKTWKYVKQNASKMALLAVARRGSHTIAVGQMGEVLVEDAAGAWKKVDSGIQNRLLSISVNSSGLAVATGEFGTVIKSTDGGMTWSTSQPDWASMADKDTFGTQEPTIYSAYVAESGEVTIAGEFGVIMRSQDGAATWKAVRPIQAKAPTLFALHIAESGEGRSFAVGQTGEFLISSDGGSSWEEHRRNTSANLLGIAATKNGSVVITGMRVMMQSDDAGSTFSFVENSDTTTEWYQAVRTESTTGKIFTVGHGGRIVQVGS